MINYSEIINRIKHLTGKTLKKEVAGLFHLSAADFSNRKRRDTLLPLIIEWAIHESVNIDWLLTGEGPMQKEEKQQAPMAMEEPASYAAIDQKTADFLRMTREVIESKTIYADALESNVVAFHRAVVRESLPTDSASLDQRVKQIENELRVIRGTGGPPGERSGDAPRKDSVATKETPEGFGLGKMGM